MNYKKYSQAEIDQINGVNRDKSTYQPGKQKQIDDLRTLVTQQASQIKDLQSSIEEIKDFLVL